AMVVSVLGFIRLWRTTRRAFAVATLPALLAFVAAGLHRYPFSDRLILFLVPGAVVSLGAGVECLTRKRKWIAIVGVLLVIVPTVGRAVFYAALPPGREEMKSVLSSVRERQKPGDSIYVFHLSDVPFRYY